ALDATTLTTIYGEEEWNKQEGGIQAESAVEGPASSNWTGPQPTLAVAGAVR
ncbi:MAG: hypothetical protein GX771_09445, partial [Halomonadaceae bacterium]|nr:hypothetical protein [Halomonadaceae bacterium]